MTVLMLMALVEMAALPTPSELPSLPASTKKQSEPNFCEGEYAESLGALAPKVREYERQPKGQYTFAVRNTATYECVSYGTDGALKRIRRKAFSHGTAFAYKQQGNDTLLLTNQHVAEFPAVTDEDHPAGDVPHGCKRVFESLKIVDNEADAYERDDVPLSLVVADPQMDVAILRAKSELPVMPWKIGHSSALRERDVVDVRGFPLGAFKATNVGKVVSAYDRDEDKDWSHDDFVIDALLSPGNSGSPVFGVSCRTGEFELVGIYHAGYTGGSALNVVVGIDQLRDLMTTLKKTSRADSVSSLDASVRTTLLGLLPPYVEPFFPFGGLPAVVRARSDGALIFQVMGRDFPLRSFPLLVIEDLPSDGIEGFGTLGRVWFGNRQGLKEYTRSELDAEAQASALRVLEALRKDAFNTFQYRVASRNFSRSREDFDRVLKMERALRKGAASRADLAQMLVDLADRLSPHGGDSVLSVADAFNLNPPEQLAASEAIPASPGAAAVPSKETADSLEPDEAKIR